VAAEVTIRVEGLGKLYHIGRGESRYRTFRETLMDALAAPFKRVKRLFSGHGSAADLDETIWAIRDITFEVKRGEVVGIIGRNGAGKSTLLKVLSRITEPTEGWADIHGRVGSLLEVGTGFHPELTGRENIYLNGSILGIKRAEIDRRFDEIVEFAEIPKFIDTPVKHYSSGMYVRLAFAVAAHLEPEVLLVDEVLAVGDVAFQRKCLGKIGDVAASGRTVLFVSHNVGAVNQLCNRAIVLSAGGIVVDAPAGEAIDEYLRLMSQTPGSTVFEEDPDKEMQILSVRATDARGEHVSTIPHTEPFDLEIVYLVRSWRPGAYVCIDLYNQLEVKLIWSSDVDSVEQLLETRPAGKYTARVRIPGHVLAPGRYHLTVSVYSPRGNVTYDTKPRVASIEVSDGGSFVSNFVSRYPSATSIPLHWNTERTESSDP